MRFALFLSALALLAVPAFISLSPEPAQASGSEDDPAICYAEPKCSGAIVGSQVPAGYCSVLKAKSVYSLLRHTCTNL